MLHTLLPGQPCEQLSSATCSHHDILSYYIIGPSIMNWLVWNYDPHTPNPPFKQLLTSMLSQQHEKWLMRLPSIRVLAPSSHLSNLVSLLLRNSWCLRGQHLSQAVPRNPTLNTQPWNQGNWISLFSVVRWGTGVNVYVMKSTQEKQFQVQNRPVCFCRLHSWRHLRTL